MLACPPVDPFSPTHSWIGGTGSPRCTRDRTAWIRRLDAMPSSCGLLISSRADVLGQDAAGSSDAWERGLLWLGLGEVLVVRVAGVSGDVVQFGEGECAAIRQRV